MAFNFGAGLAEMGGAIAKTAGTALLEQQKSDLDKERLVLADELAGKRQDKQNEFIAGQSVLDREHKTSENALNRASEEKRTAMSAGASIQSALIHERSVDKQIAAAKPIRDAELALKTIETDSKKLLFDTHKAYNDAVTGGDPAKIEQARTALEAAQFSSGDEVKKVTVQAGIVKAADMERQSIRAQMSSFEAKFPGGPMTETAKAQQADLKRQMEEADRRFNSEFRLLRSMRDGVLGQGSNKDRKPLGELPGLGEEVKARASGTATGAPLLNPPDIDAITRALGGG